MILPVDASKLERAMKATFTTLVLKDDQVNATGLQVPAEAVAAMGAGKKPKVKVSLKGICPPG